MRIFPGPRICTMLLLVTATLLSPNVSSEEAKVYVTDMLRLGLYADELATGKSLRTLLSGERLIVLERALRTVRVRVSDGTEGWVKSAYLVTEPPALLRVATLERELSAGNDELVNAREKEAVASARIAQLEANLAQTQENVRDLPNLRLQIEELSSAVEIRSTALPLSWLVSAATGTGVFGYLAGHFLLSRRIRKQFGGLRVY